MNAGEVATIQGIEMAQRFSREIGLPAGNFWIPGVSVAIARDIRTGQEPATVEARWRNRLGLSGEVES